MSNRKVEATFHGNSSKPKIKFPDYFGVLVAFTIVCWVSLLSNEPMGVVVFVTGMSTYYVAVILYYYLKHKIKEQNESK